MIKTNKNSRFVLFTLEDIREAKDVVLQIEDAHAKFDTGKACYLCEVVNPQIYMSERNERDLIQEICELNIEKRRLEKKINRLERKLERGQKEAGR